MNKSLALIFSASTATLLSACFFQSAPDSQAMAKATFEMKATASGTALVKASALPGLILGDSTGTLINLTDAHILVGRIKLESETEEKEDSNCDSSATELKQDGDSSQTENENECEEEEDDEFSLRGPFVIDLLTGTSTPDLGTITVPAGTYRKLKIELHHGESDDSAIVGENTLVANGTLTQAGGTPRPFSLSLRFTETLEIENLSGIQLDGTSMHTVLVQLMAGDWLKGLDLAGCMDAIEPNAATVEISENSAFGKCLDAEHIVKENFRKSFHADEMDDDEDDSHDDDSTGHSEEGK